MVHLNGSANGTNGKAPTFNRTAQTMYSPGSMDHIALNMRQNVMNSMMQAYLGRLSRWNGELDWRRNIDHECGYPDFAQITAQDLLDLFVKDPYANRVIQVWPKESWQVQPNIFETEKDSETAFEKDWDEVCSTFGGSLGLYQGDQASQIWEVVLRADILSRIGSYGVLVVGIDDGLPLDQPADVSGKKNRGLNFLRALPESMARVATLEDDPANPRFGHPKTYVVSFVDTRPLLGMSGGVQGAVINQKTVHWTRVVHLCESKLTSEWAAEPALKPVIAPIMNLRKVAGGSSEMFWKGGFNGTFFSTPPNMGGAIDVDMDAVQDQIEKWENGLSRTFFGQGMTAQTLGPNIADPMNHVLIQIEAICIQLEMPKRIFMGSERGELASSQDDASWNDRVKRRQFGYITPRIIVPLIERLVLLGVLSRPKRLMVEWPDVTSSSPADKANLANTYVTIIKNYVTGGCEAVLPMKRFLTDEKRGLGMTDEEADEVVKEQEEEQQKQAEAMAAQTIPGDPNAPVDPNAPPGQQPPPNPNAPPGAGGQPPPPGGAQPPAAGGLPPGAVADPTQKEETSDDSFSWLDDLTENQLIALNAFCPTGKGGGQDNSCGGKGEGFGGYGHSGGRYAAERGALKRANDDPNIKALVAAHKSPERLKAAVKKYRETGEVDLGKAPAKLDLKAPPAPNPKVVGVDQAEQKGKRAYGMTQYKGDNGAHVNEFLSGLHVHSLPELKTIAKHVGFVTPDKATRTDVMKAISARMLAKFGGVKTWFRRAAADGMHVIRVAPKRDNKTTITKKQIAAYKGMGRIKVEKYQPKPTGNMVKLVFIDEPIVNQFCATGSGGGVDPTCGKGAGAGASPKESAPKSSPKEPAAAPKSSSTKEVESSVKGVEKERTTPPPPGKFYEPNVDKGGAARVGVPADAVPPPPPIPKLPNLTPRERRVETEFAKAYEKDPDKMADQFRDLVRSQAKPGEAVTFGTDDAKALTNAWSNPKMSLQERSENRATLNTPLHQTANAVAKRAFVRELDTLKKGDEIMVTVGGCASGKGYAITSKDKDGNPNVPQAVAIKGKCKVVWDSAGDQNATENPWIQKEAEKRGLTVNYVYVHADPHTQWADPDRGAVKRAGDPKDGRMIDAKVFADSYALGARNHQQFFEQNKDNPNAKFTFLQNGSPPKLLDGIPKEALKLDRHELAKWAVDTVEKSNAPAAVKRGAVLGQRIWADDAEE